MARTQEDSYSFLTSALFIVNGLTLLVAGFLHVSGCVPHSYFPWVFGGHPDSYFPWSLGGVTAFVLVSSAGVLSALFNGMNITLLWTRHHFFKRRISLDSIRQEWLIQLVILLLSIMALFLLLLTSGGSASPFRVYLGLFPAVISVVANSRRFLITSYVLTLGVFTYIYFFSPPFVPDDQHKIHYGIASVFVFAISLFFTTVLIYNDMDEQKNPNTNRRQTPPPIQ